MLSKIDIRKINKLYSCSGKSGQKITDENTIDDNAEITKPVIPLKVRFFQNASIKQKLIGWHSNLINNINSISKQWFIIKRISV